MAVGLGHLDDPNLVKPECHSFTSTQVSRCEVDDDLPRHTPTIELEEALADYPGEVVAMGDCLAPRTVEEAILEGLKTGVSI